MNISEGANRSELGGEPERRASDSGAVTVLAQRNFRLYWLGQLVPLGRFGPLSANLVLACVAATIQGLSMASSLGLVNSFIQQAVPDQLRGRVTSLQTLVFIGIMPFSGPLMTRLVDLVSTPRELIGASLCHAIGALLLLRRLTGDAVKDALHA